jgi:membrane protease YdiL (CAAX protease family)
MAVLLALFLGVTHWWGTQVYLKSQLLTAYGLVFRWRNLQDMLRGLGIGLASVFLLFIVEGIMGWVVWLPPQSVLIKVAGEGLFIGLFVGFGEELLFRGWLLYELEKDYQPWVALSVSSIFYAVLHYIRPPDEVLRILPGFPGLVLLGFTLVWAKWTTVGQEAIASSGRLGLPMGLHAGLVWGSYLIYVGGWIEVSQKVPDWVTGIDQNPIAGLSGLLLLSGIAVYMWQRSHTPTPNKLMKSKS